MKLALAAVLVIGVVQITLGLFGSTLCVAVVVAKRCARLGVAGQTLVFTSLLECQFLLLDYLISGSRCQCNQLLR